MIIKIVAFAFVALMIWMILEGTGRKDLATIVQIIACLAILGILVLPLNEIIVFFRELANKAGMDIVYVEIVLKIIGIAYLSSLASGICYDAKADGLGMKILFAGKILILTLAIPILMSVLDAILGII